MGKQVTVKNADSSYFSEIFGRLFKDVSDLPFKKNLEGYSKEIENFINFLYSYKKFNCGYKIIEDFWSAMVVNVQMQADSYKKLLIKLPYTENKKILIAFSGGKDSVAAAIRAKKDFEPILFFTEGVNRGYSELIHAKEVAKDLNLTLKPYQISLSTKNTSTNISVLKENVIKNQYILACMIDYGLQENIRNFAFGNHSEESLNKPSNEYYNFSDYIEVFDEVNKYFKCFIPKYNFQTFVKNDTDSVCEILKTNFKLYKNITSCMCRQDAKPLARKSALKICRALPDSWCGKSCYKCAFTFILFNELGLVNNQKLLIECWKELIDKSKDRFPDDPFNPKNNINPVTNKGIPFTKSYLMKLWFDADIITQFKLYNIKLIKDINDYFDANDLFKSI